MKELNFQEVEKEIRRLVNANPENVYTKLQGPYNGCFYSKGTCTDGSVGCLLGQAFCNLGVDVSKWDRGSEYGSFSIEELVNFNEITATSDEASWLFILQQHQDEGKSWEIAVQTADEESPL